MMELTIERIGRSKTSLLEEKRRIANQGVASNDLNEINHGADLGSSQVGSLETVQIGCACFELTFEQISFFYENQHCFEIRTVFLASQLLECTLRI
jgi:hypothetical protein